MTTCVYTFEIPDLSRPIANGTEMSPSGELVPFTPEPVDPSVVGRRILAVTTSAGTYGMGGPGFIGLQLGADWLVIALWGAADWMTCRGRLVSDWFYADAGRSAPWITEQGSEAFEQMIVGQHIMAIDVQRTSLHIALSGDLDLTIAEDPATRPVFAGDGGPRVFAPEDDLRRAVFLSPTIELWV